MLSESEWKEQFNKAVNELSCITGAEGNITLKTLKDLGNNLPKRDFDDELRSAVISGCAGIMRVIGETLNKENDENRLDRCGRTQLPEPPTNENISLAQGEG